MIRMARRDEPDTMETGMWVGQSARGQGIGVAALRLLLAEAARAGSRRVVAETTYHNTAALGCCAAVAPCYATTVRGFAPRSQPISLMTPFKRELSRCCCRHSPLSSRQSSSRRS